VVIVSESLLHIAGVSTGEGPESGRGIGEGIGGDVGGDVRGRRLVKMPAGWRVLAVLKGKEERPGSPGQWRLVQRQFSDIVLSGNGDENHDDDDDNGGDGDDRDNNRIALRRVLLDGRRRELRCAEPVKI
jgi:hypothetical protein